MTRLHFLGVDLEQAEARVVAYESGCKFQIDAFNAGKNIHIVNAEIIFPGQTIVKDPDPKGPYQKSKKIVHLTNYGGTKHAMAPILHLPQATVDVMQRRYFERCPEIKRWQGGIARKVESGRMLVTQFGRRMYFRGRLDRSNKAIRSAISFIPQATVVDAVNLAMARIWQKIKLPERICLNVYDALVMLVLRERDEFWEEEVRKAFDVELKSSRGVSYAIPYEVQFGETWDDV